MSIERANEFGFAPAHDVPIPYLQRIRTYYQALGYGAPYEWAHYTEVPFRPLPKPLSRCRIGLITTAAPFREGAGDQGPGAPYNAKAKFYAVYSGDTRIDHDLRISHVAIDRQHTTAEDPAAYFPLAELRRSAASGRIGSLAPRFHGAPTNRSHRATLEIDGPEIVARCKADAVDAAILVRQLPRVPPDRQPGGAPAGAERHRQRGDGLRQGHRRAGGCAAPAVFRLPARQRCRAAQGCRVASLHARACTAHARDGPGRRAPRCSRRCAGASIPTGSSTTATSNVSGPKKSAAGALSSTRRSRRQSSCARRHSTWRGRSSEDPHG